MASGGRRPDEPGGLVEIHCRGCWRRLGVGPTDYRIYCDPFCAADYPTTSVEQRDAVIEALAIMEEATTGGPANKAALARMFNLSRQSINSILDSRSIRKEAA